MRVNGKDIVLAGLAVAIVAIILLFGFPNQVSGDVTTTWTVDFGSTPAPIAPGNVTTWTFAGGAWTMKSVANGGHSVWVFSNITSQSTCTKGDMLPLEVTVDFVGLPSPLHAGNSTTWSYDQGEWTASSEPIDGRSVWVLSNMSQASKCFKGDTVTTTLTIDFVNASPTTDPGNLTTWTKIGEEWVKTSVANDGHTVWVFENITSKPTCYAQLQVAEGIGGFDDVNASFYIIGGILIQGIAGLENQNNGGPGWQYYLNDVYATRSCSLTYLSNGDTVVWMYKPLAG
jgi:Domain of unknown function (DUF4430)